ncbi:MAG: transcription/repair factor TFIIH subunit Tfb3 [Amphiamblys sp. WSBS2006]|nr:MAG: transcription/repair factor TFIIH subunit Tfb3 [Amphiamblys sp. WSBS2006]
MECCPVCRNDSYLAPEMKLLVPLCFHRLCTVCIDRLFKKGPAKCPEIECVEILRKTDFFEPFFGDLHLEKEVRMRRRVGVHKKTRESFNSEEEYADYLEELENRYEKIMAVRGFAEQERMIEQVLRQTREEHGEKEKSVSRGPVTESTQPKVCFVGVPEKGEHAVESVLSLERLSTRCISAVCEKAFYDAFNESLFV